jgi:hypothetical protein
VDPNCVKTCATCRHDERYSAGDPGACANCQGWNKFEPVETAVVSVPVAVADGAGGAVKADTGKVPMSLLPRSALTAEAAVLAFGAKKYAAHNWRKGMVWSRLLDAALRHLTAFADGEDVDPETGLSHLAHLRCCAGFLIEYQEKGLGQDDRHTVVS